MKRRSIYLVSAMWLALATTPSLHASGQADERYEVTPTTLPELIEGVGLEAIDWDVWTVYRQDGEPIVHTRTRAYVDGDVVVFAEYSQVLHSDIYARVCLYTTEGELLEDRYWVREKVRGGWAEEGQWVLRTVFSDRNVTTFFLNENGGWDPQLQYTYQPLDEAVHEFWVPLAVQYHIERAHERFELERFYYPVNSGSLRRLRFQLSGTQTLLVDGQATDCFVYEVVEETRHRDPQSEQQSWVAYKVFTSEGHFVREWYPHSPPETDDISRCEPGVMPDGFEDFPFMIEAGIGDEVFGRAGEDTLVDVEEADESTDQLEVLVLPIAVVLHAVAIIGRPSRRQRNPLLARATRDGSDAVEKPMKATRTFGLALTLLTALALSSPLAPAWAGEPGVQPAVVAEHPAAGLVYDQWYLDTVDGQPSGYTHEWLTILDDGRIETGYASRRVESHGGDLMVSDSRVVWLETANLRPISVTSESSAGTGTVRQTYTLLADGIELVSEQSGRTTTRRLPAVVGDWLSPTAFELAWRERSAAGEDVFELTTWDPDMGSTPVTLRYEREDAEQLEMPTGEVIETTRWKVNYSAIPGVDLYELYDADAVMLAQRVSFAGLDMASYLTDESVAALEFEPPEMAGNSTVRPDQPIRRPQRVQRAVFDLTFGDGAPEDLLPPTTPHQRAERLDNGKVRLTVDLGALNALAEQDTPGTDPSYMDASIMIDHSDEEVRRLAEVVRGRAGDEPDAERYAKAARRYVTRYVTGLNLATGDATASEVARNRSGDCTECSVLLAAILRAQGIPSRCVTGLAYADTEFAGESDVFVYHMWTQAWIEDASEQGGRWLDLDAALYRYTATHITLGTSAMGDAEAAGEMIRMLPLMNGLVIEVVETEQ